MIVEYLSTAMALKPFLQSLGVDGGGVAILKDKGEYHRILIRDLPVGGANILKQDALSIGADLAVPKGTVIAATPKVDVLLLATTRQLKQLIDKEQKQPFGLSHLSHELGRFTHLSLPKSVEVMGIINANEDSFYPQSRFYGDAAMAKIETMIQEGATIIDIGGVSSRPGSVGVSDEEELSRVKPIVDLVYHTKAYEKVRLSLDSYSPTVIAYALERGFSIVNDIRGLADDRVASLCAAYHATVVIMHAKGDPKTMQHNPKYESVVHEVEQFFRERLEKADRFGIRDIILDTGIGFGKRLEDNVALIRHQKHFSALGKPLLVGASRKSMIDHLSPSATHDRLGGTLAIHLKAIEEGASIVRVHDVKEHVQAIAVWKALRG